MKKGQIFLDNRKHTFKDLNLKTDSDLVIEKSGYLTFYHYTHWDNLSLIFKEDSGLLAMREVACPAPPVEFVGCYVVEGFLSPMPK